MQLPIHHIPASMEIHIIAPFIQLNGGDWHAIDLFMAYGKTHQVKLWSAQPPHPALAKQYPIKEIKPYRGESPHSGVLIISGARTEIGSWFSQNQFSEVVLIHNLLSPGILYKALNRLNKALKKPVEIIYVSDLVKRYAALPGKVVHHMPSSSRFKPLDKDYQEDKFVVGRVSTDMLAKHNHRDIQVYRELAKQGIQVRITGGTCLAPWLAGHKNIALNPVADQGTLPQVYAQLDCFYYRVPSSVKDPFPLVVLEAMLTGLPVVCHRDVGTVEIIDHGVNGFVFDTPEQAIEIIDMLKKNANLRKEVGMRAKLITTKIHC
jgi:glycosyltransferase involved in cell wall biosynthesis